MSVFGMSVLGLFRSRAILRPRQLTCLARSRTTTTTRAFTVLPPDIPIEEERIPGYNARQFYPVNPGDILDERFEILAKLGFGSFSTVWLSKLTPMWGLPSDRYVTLKVCVSNENTDRANHEVDISARLEANPSHDGFRFVRTMHEDFEIVGPHGIHKCLVYDPMRETIKQFQRRLPDGKIPSALLKHYIQHLLLALDYLHGTCGIVHTDIKQDNILMGFEDPAVVEDFVQRQLEGDMARKVYHDRSIYLSHDDFGPLRSFRMLPKLGDFGLAELGESLEPNRVPIQPPLFQAPEVLLGTGWSYSADIWNLGVLIWNLLEARDLFRDISNGGIYDSRRHLGEMIALLGPPPKELSEREARWSEVKWKTPFPGPEGRPCWTPRELYGGPFFNANGDFLYEELIPSDLNFRDSLPSLEGEEKEVVLDFVSHMLQWLPEKRKTAAELLKHPWLANCYKFTE